MRLNFRRHTYLAATLALTLVFSACGGGGGEDGPVELTPCQISHQARLIVDRLEAVITDLITKADPSTGRIDQSVAAKAHVDFGSQAVSAASPEFRTLVQRYTCEKMVSSWDKNISTAMGKAELSDCVSRMDFWGGYISNDFFPQLAIEEVSFQVARSTQGPDSVDLGYDLDDLAIFIHNDSSTSWADWTYKSNLQYALTLLDRIRSNGMSVYLAAGCQASEAFALLKGSSDKSKKTIIHENLLKDVPDLLRSLDRNDAKKDEGGKIAI